MRSGTIRKEGFCQSHSSMAPSQGLRLERATAEAGTVTELNRSRREPRKRHGFVERALRDSQWVGGTLLGGMVDEANAVPGAQSLHQGLADMRQTWQHLARELAPGVPELPGVIDQQLAGLSLADLNEENLIKVADSLVARVAEAGFPDQAAALLRRMGRAMYELLLLLATQQEIREMVVPPTSAADPAPVPVAAEPTTVALAVASEPAAAPRPSGEVDPAPTPVVSPEAEPPAPIPAVAPPRPEPDSAPAAAPVAASGAGPRKSAAQAIEGRVPVPVAPFQARDPIRPTASANGKTPPTLSAAEQEATLLRKPPQARPTEPVSVPKTKEGAPAPQHLAPSSASVVRQLLQRADPRGQTAPPTAAESPERRAPAFEPAPEVAQSSDRGPDRQPAPALRQSALRETQGQLSGATPKQLTDDDAPLWGFDPAARQSAAAEPPTETFEPEPPADELVTAGVSPSAEPVADEETGTSRAQKLAWTVRLSPRTRSDREKKLVARQAQLPSLVDEIVAAAKVQQEALSVRGNARRALSSARESLPLAERVDPSTQIEALLEAGQIEEAASMAVQVATTVGGEDAAGLACAVGEGVKQSKNFELAVLCFTTAVLSCPPCDRACWQLCNLSIERKDMVMAPIWLEFVARLLRARGADIDAISVYQQLLRLTPRRTDIREMLRISTLTGVLPD